MDGTLETSRTIMPSFEVHVYVGFIAECIRTVSVSNIWSIADTSLYTTFTSIKGIVKYLMTQAASAECVFWGLEPGPLYLSISHLRLIPHHHP